MDKDVQSLLQKHRHPPAFERLLDLYEVTVFRIAVLFGRDRDRAEDIMQDVFLKPWQVLPVYDGRAAMLLWRAMACSARTRAAPRLLGLS